MRKFPGLKFCKELNEWFYLDQEEDPLVSFCIFYETSWKELYFHPYNDSRIKKYLDDCNSGKVKI